MSACADLVELLSAFAFLAVALAFFVLCDWWCDR